jgi:hypothetical protein
VLEALGETTMLSVMFGALPKKVDRDDHLHNARMLRPELEQEEGFVDDMLHERAQGGPDPLVVECRSENSLVRWRTRERRLEETEVGTGRRSRSSMRCARSSGERRPTTITFPNALA